ncbi:MFS transporter [Serratia quinivorans]|uniref:MFS transporter n=1 Tax=Serratia quinivorans TaxID=137545 RepID=UPI00217B1441|nr:MFS transporter [Serratia quinivorans]CAI0819581.1 Spectinomycin tetracycline efflux pump [Serratia quinivorans]CAI0822497.1 Spectinomycin tetracycline efflux pump [Serratia quinivorans]CAI0845439.1 Spectinomycin tetracycline efflux pump [Serratia quinivorans]CAI1497629.1 Spectinomycin tetracycline efflux pump [Serratia quinivorans]CAI2036746.1 Spectinomycin tetracycline efflux pump [Serratia quinivorans]
MKPITQHAAPSPHIGGILASLSLSMLVSSLGASIANIGLPTLAQAFNTSFQAVQWVMIVYLLAVTTSIIAVGRLGDRIGRRRLLLLGIGLFSIASAFCAIAPDIWLLLAARIAQGLGAAVMMAMTMALVGETLGKENTGRAMGLLGSMSAIGTALGPSLGGALIFGFGWRAMFLVNFPLGLLAFILVYRYLPGNSPQLQKDNGRFDLPGTLLLGLTLASYALSMTLRQGDFGTINLLLLLCAGLGTVLFIRLENNTASPLIQLTLFHQPGLSSGLMMSALVMTVMMTSLVVGPFYLTGGLGLAVGHAGLAMSAGPLVAALFSVPAGRLVDRLGAKKITAVGLAVMTLGAAVMSMMSLSQGVFGYVAPLCLITLGYSLFQVANNTALMKHAAPEQRGVISGMVNLARNLGLITGASAMGALFMLAANTGDIKLATAEAISHGMRVTYLVAGVLVAIALVMIIKNPAAIKPDADYGRE